MKTFHQRKNFKGRPPPPAAAAKTSWEGVSNWYGEHMNESETLLKGVVYPNALRILAPVANKSYLDIACGEGAFSRLIGQAGGIVAGFDAAPSLIERAKRLGPRGNYLVADAVNFGKHYPSRVFDGASCLLAIQNIDRPESVFRNANQVLKDGAPLVLIMNHPCFRIPRQSSWGWEEERQIQYRRIDMYMSPLKIPIVAHPGADKKTSTLSYHHPLSFYVNALKASGFLVEAMEELVSNRVSDSGARAKAENRSRAEIPMFLALRAIKK